MGSDYGVVDFNAVRPCVLTTNGYGNRTRRAFLVHRLIRSVHKDMKSANVFKLLESVRRTRLRPEQ